MLRGLTMNTYMLRVPPAKLTTDGRRLEPGKVAHIRIPSFMGAKFEKRPLELAK